MNTFEIDENNDEVLLSKDQSQVMMEWEKPYMEASIDFLQPKGNVLEIGFGCGYSASQILKHPIKSYTVIECDGVVIKKAKEWAKKYNTPITIIEGTWQDKLHSLGVFDEIYFDDFPLNINEKSSQLEIVVSRKRLNIFVDLCIQNHTRIGSKICFYLNGNNEIILSSDAEPFIKKESKRMNITIPKNCKYRNIKEQKCMIPLITKIREYDFEYANKKALESIMR